MSITDELREWAEDNTLQDMVLTTYPPQHVVRGVLETLLRIADRIDAEHERGMADAYLSGTPTDEQMTEHGWVRGPLDADGEMWRRGDMSDSNWGVIEGIAYENGRWLISGHDMSAPWVPADSIRHYHAPTVEDVLREMADRIYADEYEPRDRDAIVAEYAAKLRLAGGDTE